MTVATMSKSGAYRKNANRLRNELRIRNSSIQSNELGENSRDQDRPPGLKGREIGMWYAERNKRKKELELAAGGGVKVTRMVSILVFVKITETILYFVAYRSEHFFTRKKYSANEKGNF